MNLVIDQGNTAVKLALFDADKLLQKSVFANSQPDLAIQWLNQNVSMPVNTILCSVADIELDLTKINTRSFFRLDENLPVPIINDYQNPALLGKDRLANAVGVWKINPDKASLSIDLGTCIKYDLVTSDGHYKGGVISPGIFMRFKAMHEFTDKLPLIESPAAYGETGLDSISSMTIGVMEGAYHEINGFIDRYLSLYSDLTIFMTGGDLGYFDKAFKKPIFAQPDLTLIGLNEILQHNILQK